jgi:hypothetical protein
LIKSIGIIGNGSAGSILYEGFKHAFVVSLYNESEGLKVSFSPDWVPRSEGHEDVNIQFVERVDKSLSYEEGHKSVLSQVDSVLFVCPDSLHNLFEVLNELHSACCTKKIIVVWFNNGGYSRQTYTHLLESQASRCAVKYDDISSNPNLNTLLSLFSDLSEAESLNIINTWKEMP